MANDSNRRISNGLVALSSAAILGIYGAGYFRTRAAARQLEGEAARRRDAAPVAQVAQSAPAPRTAPVAPLIGPPEPAPRSTGLIGPRPGTPPETPTAVPEDGPSEPKAASPVMPSPGAAASVPAVAPAAAVPAATPAAPAAPAAAPPPTPPVTAAASAPRPAPSAEPARSTGASAPAAASASASAAAPAADAATTATEGGAPAADAPPKPGDAVPIVYKDGNYLGWGSCRHGQIQAHIIIENGKITSSSIAKCLTRYSCSWIKPIVPQVVQRQSPDVDYISGATESSDAFYYAVVAALDQAK